jgi:hypothetical protein
MACKHGGDRGVTHRGLQRSEEALKSMWLRAIANA